MFSKKNICLYLLFFSLFTFAQWTPPPNDPGFGGGSGDPATEPLDTPIDSLLFPLIVTALIISFQVVKKRGKEINS